MRRSSRPRSLGLAAAVLSAAALGAAARARAAGEAPAVEHDDRQLQAWIKIELASGRWIPLAEVDHVDVTSQGATIHTVGGTAVSVLELRLAGPETWSAPFAPEREGVFGRADLVRQLAEHFGVTAGDLLDAWRHGNTAAQVIAAKRWGHALDGRREARIVDEVAAAPPATAELFKLDDQGFHDAIAHHGSMLKLAHEVFANEPATDRLRVLALQAWRRAAQSAPETTPPSRGVVPRSDQFRNQMHHFVGAYIPRQGSVTKSVERELLRLSAIAGMGQAILWMEDNTVVHSRSFRQGLEADVESEVSGAPEAGFAEEQKARPARLPQAEARVRALGKENDQLLFSGPVVGGSQLDPLKVKVGDVDDVSEVDGLWEVRVQQTRYTFRKLERHGNDIALDALPKTAAEEPLAAGEVARRGRVRRLRELIPEPSTEDIVGPLAGAEPGKPASFRTLTSVDLKDAIHVADVGWLVTVGEETLHFLDRDPHSGKEFVLGRALVGAMPRAARRADPIAGLRLARKDIGSLGGRERHGAVRPVAPSSRRFKQ